MAVNRCRNRHAASRSPALKARASFASPRKKVSNRITTRCAQREAFISSQAGEGWRLIKTTITTAAALQQLLEDIRKGLVDIVLVYKVDRLTRALTDFAKMVELFDAQGVSFVAVTQQFNTTTSMGRLTLNVLLSFDQFEREVPWLMRMLFSLGSSSS